MADHDVARDVRMVADPVQVGVVDPSQVDNRPILT